MMKKVLYILVFLYMFRLNVYGEDNELKQFHPCLQPGLSAMYSSVNDTIKGDYLGWPLTCVPLPFTYVAEVDSITGLTVYEYVETQPVYTGNKKYIDNPEMSQLFFVSDAINSLECDIPKMLTKIDITVIIDKYGNVLGERFTGKNENELNLFQQEFLKKLPHDKKWIPGKINGQNVNTKLRMLTHVNPNNNR